MKKELSHPCHVQAQINGVYRIASIRPTEKNRLYGQPDIRPLQLKSCVLYFSAPFSPSREHPAQSLTGTADTTREKLHFEWVGVFGSHPKGAESTRVGGVGSRESGRQDHFWRTLACLTLSHSRPTGCGLVGLMTQSEWADPLKCVNSTSLSHSALAPKKDDSLRHFIPHIVWYVERGTPSSQRPNHVERWLSAACKNLGFLLSSERRKRKFFTWTWNMFVTWMTNLVKNPTKQNPLW